MKQIVLKTCLILSSLLIFLNCKKKENTAEDPGTPDPYVYNSELQSSKDISFATAVICDFDGMCAFASQTSFGPYAGIPLATTNTCTLIRDTISRMMSFSFNQSTCSDGKTRDGSVIFGYGYNATTNPAASANAKCYEYYGYVASLTLSNFVANGWKVELYDPSKLPHISNTLSGNLYDPAVTNLTWEISGKFKFTHPTDATRNLVWEGKLVKTLINTSDKNVFPSKLAVVKWSLAKTNTTGTVTGTYSSGTQSFNYSIDNTSPLYRDYSCSYAPPGTAYVTQFHPVVTGKSNFTISNYHPRTIDHGPTLNCDNSVEVSFNGEKHTVVLDY